MSKEVRKVSIEFGELELSDLNFLLQEGIASFKRDALLDECEKAQYISIGKALVKKLSKELEKLESEQATRLTKLENEVLDRIDLFTCGFGETPEFILDCFKKDGYDTRVVRGAIGSLVKKGKLLHQGDVIYINE